MYPGPVHCGSNLGYELELVCLFRDLLWDLLMMLLSNFLRSCYGNVLVD